MKKIGLIICCLFMHFAHAQKISALYESTNFYSPETGPYIETHLLFDASTLQFEKNDKNAFQANVEMKLIIKRSDSLVFEKVYNLKSPEISSLEEKYFTFLDIQRFALSNGVYTLELFLKDTQANDTAFRFTDKFAIYFLDDRVSLSDIQFISESTPSQKESMLTKNGLDIQPYVGTYFPKEVSQIKFYYEIYHLTKTMPEESPFIINTFVETAQTGAKNETLQSMKKGSAKKVNAVIGGFDISQLPSGNYNLVIEIRDSENQVMTYGKSFFQRSNPDLKAVTTDSTQGDAHTFASNINNDSLLYHYIQSLDPIASSAEQTFIRKQAKISTLKEKQLFFYQFWYNRNSVEPQVEWGRFKKLYDRTVRDFTIPRMPGYATDRGYIYLKYGEPSRVIDEKFKTTMVSTEDEYGRMIKQQVSYYPYQIWRYDVLGNNQTNCAFVFWLSSTGNDYKLLHSNALGEIDDPFWEQRLSRNQLKEDEVGIAGQQFIRGF